MLASIAVQYLCYRVGLTSLSIALPWVVALNLSKIGWEVCLKTWHVSEPRCCSSLICKVVIFLLAVFGTLTGFSSLKSKKFVWLLTSIFDNYAWLKVKWIINSHVSFWPKTHLILYSSNKSFTTNTIMTQVSTYVYVIQNIIKKSWVYRSFFIFRYGFMLYFSY